MKKVCLLRSNLSHVGGIEKYTLRLAKGFVEKGCEVTILTTGDVSTLPAPCSNFHMTTLGKLSSIGFLRIRQFDQLCKRWLKDHSDIEVVFGMDRNSYQTHIRAGNGVHAAYLKRRLQYESSLKKLSFRFNPLHQMILHYERLSFENPQLIKLFTNSHMVRREVLEHYKIDEQKVQVLHNRVEWHEMQKPFEEWERKREENRVAFGLSRDSFHFLFIGNGYRRKGLEVLLRSLSTLREYDFQLSVIGKDKTQEIRYFDVLTEQLGLKEKVKFFGVRKDVISFYQVADALVIPSFYDPFANVTVEALAMGLFVVSSSSNGGSEILSSSNGIVVENIFDIGSLVFALKEAMRYPKTSGRSLTIRNSVKHLDFSLCQLKDITLTQN